MKRSVIFHTLFIALIITGCSAVITEPPKSTPESPTFNLPMLDDNWKIELAHSGGIMGLSRSIEISSDGTYTVTDKRANKTISRDLSADEISKINELVESSDYIFEDKPDGMACADCFIYDLEIQGGGEKFTVQLNDINLPNSGLEPLVVYLRGLIEKELK